MCENPCLAYLEWTAREQALQTELARSTLDETLNELIDRQIQSGFCDAHVVDQSELAKVSSLDGDPHFFVLCVPRRQEVGAINDVPPTGVPAIHNGCFLCPENQVWQSAGKQFGFHVWLPTGRMLRAVVNPHPIAPNHIVFASAEHKSLAPTTPAHVQESVGDFVALARQLRGGDWTLYCNSHGSAPEHWHANGIQWKGPTFPLVEAARLRLHYPVCYHAFDIDRDPEQQICDLVVASDGPKPANLIFVDPIVFVIPRKSHNVLFQGGNLQSLELLGVYVTGARDVAIAHADLWGALSTV